MLKTDNNDSTDAFYYKMLIKCKKYKDLSLKRTFKESILLNLSVPYFDLFVAKLSFYEIEYLMKLF